MAQALAPHANRSLSGRLGSSEVARTVRRLKALAPDSLTAPKERAKIGSPKAKIIVSAAATHEVGQGAGDLGTNTKLRRRYAFRCITPGGMFRF
jgi:hypothetical protein